MSFPIVAVGASAGGLEACSRLMAALPERTGMAFILVQHLDPSHESLLAELLAKHTAMPVRQAEDGTAIEPDHVYVIPPGAYLSVAGDTLHLSEPEARHGARLPFDFLLQSMALSVGARAICVVLSGTGADGSVGLTAVKEKGGLVVAQDPEEAAFDGMPRSAIATGQVDLVLSVAKIPDAILSSARVLKIIDHPGAGQPQPSVETWLDAIINLLRSRIAHDFTLYKPGTLQRRIERRMAMAAIPPGDGERYLELLRSDGKELDSLAHDLLIHVTGFFRDPSVFRALESQIIPDLVRAHETDRPIRVWIAGCSTGEEAYSLAMLFQEQIEAGRRGQKLQVFASDLDAASVGKAREGLFPATIEGDMPGERLSRFFDKTDTGYRAKATLRSDIVFAVQDVLSDPPFSRIDLVSCRNLLIYLSPAAQKTVLSLFHFALRPNGILLLGNSENPGPAEGRFEVVSQADRIFRRIGRSLPGDLDLHRKGEGAGQLDARRREGTGPSVRSALASLCERALLNGFAPAAALVDLHYTCLHFSGATHRYLRLQQGPATQSLLQLVPSAVRPRLRSALHRAAEGKARVAVPGGSTVVGGETIGFDIDVQPVAFGPDTLLLVCFTDRQGEVATSPPETEKASRVLELERDLDAVRAELQDALGEIDLAHEQQKIASEEALSINEEYQSTNEELLTSKEELQSLNEELTALNAQLHETLDRQRTTSDDLQNVLFSTDVATLFLDKQLNIRFFTPATKLLFNVIATDIGRPISDLHLVAGDADLLQDARTVLSSLAPIEKEIEGPRGAWYMRRILPYRANDAMVGGVVITFVDVTERRHVADALKAAEETARNATAAKTRFLAAASHDLRQPLQTLALLQGLLAKSVEGEAEACLVARVADTLDAMSGMLNTLLDVNQIEAGIVQPAFVDFPIGELLVRLRDEFSYHAEAQGLSLRVVRCGVSIRSDPKLLEQILRNLLSNALKYTRKGKILLGCRRHGGKLSIEIWDTGVGIATRDLTSIFEEYHQLDNAARERSRGLGLGLAIVQRLASMLDHRVSVRSQPGRGSAFAIEVTLPKSGTTPIAEPPPLLQSQPRTEVGKGVVLIVDDEPLVLELLQLYLTEEGHQVECAADGQAALDLVKGGVRPDVVLTDYNLPGGMSGVALSESLRKMLSSSLPVIVLSGDISTDSLRAIARAECIHLNKPVKLSDLSKAIGTALASPTPIEPVSAQGGAIADTGPAAAVIYVVDDNESVRDTMRAVFEDSGRTVRDFASSEAFLRAYIPGANACLIVDAYMPGMSGVELLKTLRHRKDLLPAVMITGSSDVPIAVQAMKAGAFDFIEKPVGRDELLASVARALEQAKDTGKPSAWREAAARQIATLTGRQREIMTLVVAGYPSKIIAKDLKISQRTVENHRAAIMKRTGAKSLPALARLALAAEGLAAGNVVEAIATS